MNKKEYSLKNIDEFIGKEFDVSPWLTIDQTRIDQFALCTNNFQWIHCDHERAKSQSPFRKTIAHDYLLLSVLADLQSRSGLLPHDAHIAMNVGLNKVRFFTPVKSGSRVRNKMHISSNTNKGEGYLLKTMNTLELEGSDVPALIAETLVLVS